MVIVYPADGDCPERPPFCGCENPCRQRFQKKGSYVRVMTQAVCRFWHCRGCSSHITMIPSTCVPYKQFPADTVEYCLGEAVDGRAPADIEQDRANVQGASRSTIRQWLAEWIGHSAVLVSIVSGLLSRPVSCGFHRMFHLLRNHYQGSGFFVRLQPDLCCKGALTGVFRPLIARS